MTIKSMNSTSIHSGTAAIAVLAAFAFCAAASAAAPTPSQASAAAAQSPSSPAAQTSVPTAASSDAAPVPPALINAKKIFLSNAGADSGLFPHPFSGSPDRGYNLLYALLQRSGRYEIVGSPEDADLVFELQLSSPFGPQNPNKVNGAPDPLPMFRLVILDRKTHYILWTFTESVDRANLQKTHDRNFEQAVEALVSDLKDLTNRATVAQAANRN